MLQRERKLVLLYSTQFWQWWACSSRTAVWFLRFMQRAAFAWTQPFFFLFQCRLASHFLQIATANCHRHSLNNSCRRPCLSIYSCPILLSDYCWWQISVRIACFWQCSVPDIAGPSYAGINYCIALLFYIWPLTEMLLAVVQEMHLAF